MHLLKLPNEILIYMAESLDQEEEIFFLSLACRRLEFLLGYVLYQHNIRYSGSSALLWAARHGRIETATRILETCRWREGVSPKLESCLNSSSLNNGPTALSIAVQHGNLELVKLLLSAGADPNTRSQPGESLFTWAARNGKLESIKLLREHGARFGAEHSAESHLLPLLRAAHGKHYAVAAYLWDALELHSTIGFQNEQTHALLLNISAACGWQGLVERILKKGCPVDAIWANETIFPWPQRCSTPLCIAAAHGHYSVVKFLLKHKADLDPASELTTDPEAMLSAIRGRHFAIVELLLDYGTDPNSFDSCGVSALTLALPHPPTFQLLLRRGAHINDKRVIILSRTLLLFSLLSVAFYRFC